MQIKFYIDYHTVFGEELLLNVVSHNEKQGKQTSVYRMSTRNGQCWTYEMACPPKAEKGALEYYYSVECNGKEVRREWQMQCHRLSMTAVKGTLYEVFDAWSEIPQDTYLYSSAFTDCINRRSAEALKPTDYALTLRIKVRAPQLRSFERLALVGDADAIGGWNVNKALTMTEEQPNEWTVDVNASALAGEQLAFKFVALNLQNRSASLWETCPNRTIAIPQGGKGTVWVYSLDQSFFDIRDVRIAGTLIPVFSLRTEKSFGVGDFGDLKRMIDFVSATGQRVLQLLPINDTTATHTWKDSYPYSCISIFALHPQYVALDSLPALKDEKLRSAFKKQQAELNSLPEIDYEKVNNAKNAYLQALYEQEGAGVLGSKAFQTFFEENAQWLVPYAQYCSLREQYGTGDFTRWATHGTWNEADRVALSTPSSAQYQVVAFYYFVQYILYTQMKEVHAYASHKQVVLKGDIPIGVSRYGCDVWMEPKYFNLDSQAGAPPDDFSVNGQNWGFPTYNWDEMLRDDCSWWVRRFSHMAHFFDAYRIDHVLGFFRIWDIPIDSVNGLLGQFSPSLGMTKDEIEAYGLHFQEELFTCPFIADWVLQRIFKEHAEEVKATYLVHAHDDIFNLKSPFDTQRRIEKAFEGKESEKDIWLRDGLYALVSNVLFVRDRHDSSKFHPRITAQLNLMYEALWDNDKAAFNRLYNDYYYKRNNHYWYCEAMKKLPLLTQATKMLVCAEDLGMVPDCVQWVMDELRIFSLEIQSMPKDPKVRFGHLGRNPYRSVATISSHDMPTLRLWWDENSERTQDYYNNMLYRHGAAPHPLPGWLAADVVFKHLASPSALCVLSLQDWLAIDETVRLPNPETERINVPSNPNHYWRYRMHVPIEQLLANHELVNRIADMVQASGR